MKSIVSRGFVWFVAALAVLASAAHAGVAQSARFCIS
jgi:hypothetical protein